MPELVNSGDPASEDFPTGPAIGELAPDFALPDQSGRPVQFSAARGGGRSLILFYRSASWWGFCKSQLVELQRNLENFARNEITVFAISPDPTALLERYAAKHGITYPLLSDSDSRVIGEFGILNTHIPEDHDWFGLPYPGTFMLDSDGRVFDKSFFADHCERESANDFLQESFRVEDPERGEVHTRKTPHLGATAYLASPTVRRSQRTVLTVEVDLAEDMHVYGRPLPEGYIPIELSVDGGEALELVEVEYPESEEISFDVIGESLPAYEGSIIIKATCSGTGAEDESALVHVSLRYQACDSSECYVPETVNFDLPVRVLPHDWDQIELE